MFRAEMIFEDIKVKMQRFIIVKLKHEHHPILANSFFSSGLFCSAIAQHQQRPTAGARGAAMGGTGVLFQDIHSAFSNPAGVARLENAEILAFGEQRFLNSPIQQIGVAFAYPLSIGTVGVTAHSFGIEDYQERKFGLLYARPLLENLTIGAQFNYFQTQVPRYGNKSIVSFELGIQMQLATPLQFGVHVYNPIPLTWVDDVRLPSVFTAALSYTPSQRLLLTAELEKELDFAPRFRAGLEYNFSERFFLRAGVATQFEQVSLGIGLALENGLRIDVAARYHPVLGMSPSAGVVYGF